MKKIYLAIVLSIILLLSIVNAQEISKDKALKIAESLFEQEVPNEAKGEYKLIVSDKTTHPYLYEFMWSRYINGVVHNDDRYVVKVDERDGSIFQKYLTYSGPAFEFNTIPTLTKGQIKWFAGKFGNVTEDPSLFIRDKKLYWYVELNYEQFAEFDSHTGELVRGSTSTQQDLNFNVKEYYYYKIIQFLPIVFVTISMVALVYLKRKFIFKLLFPKKATMEG